MTTYERNGVHLEQCDKCRGIFLDFGELEAMTQMENRFVQSAPPPPQPGMNAATSIRKAWPPAIPSPTPYTSATFRTTFSTAPATKTASGVRVSCSPRSRLSTFMPSGV